MFLNNWNDDREFTSCFFIALFVHITFLIIIHVTPDILIRDIPYKTVRVKVGVELAHYNNANISKTYFTQEEKIEQPKEKVEATKAEVIKENSKSKKNKSNKEKSNKIEHKQNPMLQQQNIAQKSQIQRISRKNEHINYGSRLGNTNEDIITVQNYEKILSLWILQYKLYPTYSKKAGHEGKGIIAITINRSGKIQDYYIKQTTSYNELDEAMVDMIRMANPVPIPPKEYPGEEFLHFLIPVKFTVSF